MKPPDVLALIIEHMPGAVGARVVDERPDDGTSTFVRVLRTGGQGRENRLRQVVQVTLDSYARTKDGAKLLADNADEWMHSLPASSLPINAILGSSTPSDFPDTDTRSARYTATYQVGTRVR